MAMKTKTDLKDVFNGLSSLYYTAKNVDLDGENDKGGVALPTVAWDYELPVTVDTLQISQDDPTINHYKVIGLQGDWTSSAEAGDLTIEFTVPTKHTDVIKLAFGEDASKNILASDLGELGTGWSGQAVKISMHKVTGTIGLLDETKKNIMLINNIALYATPMYENASTEPFAIKFSGSIETTGDSNFAWLKKA